MGFSKEITIFDKKIVVNGWQTIRAHNLIFELYSGTTYYVCEKSTNNFSDCQDHYY